MRLLFFVPSAPAPQGGINVILDMIQVLNANGHAAVALFDRPDYAYPFHAYTPPRLFDPALKWEPEPSLKSRVKHAVLGSGRGQSLPIAPECGRWTPTVGDTVVVPEFVAHLLPQNLPKDTPIVLLAQAYYPFWQFSSDPGFRAERFSHAVATSDACAEACRILLNREPKTIPLALSDQLFAFTHDQKMQIAYMPRRRAQDAKALLHRLQMAPELADVPIVPIDGVTRDDAARLLSESLFFLSFSQTDGFGLPPAEAMASGSIVIGYRGVGGNEFFTSETGFPVEEDDLNAYFHTVVKVVGDYKADPKPLDVFRKKASDRVLNTYNWGNFENRVLQTFSEILN